MFSDLLAIYAGKQCHMDIRWELSYLYKNKAVRQEMGELSILLLTIGVFMDAIQFRSRADLSTSMDSTLDGQYPHKRPGSMPSTPQWATECLQILSPDNCTIGTGPSLKAVIYHHYHVICILLNLPFGELFCYGGWRVTSAAILKCRNRLRLWVTECGEDSRRVALHAGRLFGHFRSSDMNGYYESTAMLIACFALCIYGEFGAGQDHAITQLGNDDLGSVFRLNRAFAADEVQQWLQAGSSMRPYLAGVGSILGRDGVARLVNEGAQIMCSSTAWGHNKLLGESLRIYHELGSRIGRCF